jgi:hypothetical protein
MSDWGQMAENGDKRRDEKSCKRQREEDMEKVKDLFR